MNDLPKRPFQLPAKAFYVADCAVTACSFVSRNQRFDAALEGYAALVSGELELEFNWLAQGGGAGDAFEFAVRLDEANPEFELMGADDLPEEAFEAACLAILAASQWQQEVAECLPKSEAELAALQ